MFSGIIETTSPILRAQNRGSVVEICVRRPSQFNDLHVGDSIAHNGVCLTLESFDDQHMIFALAAETLQVTGWTPNSLEGTQINLERSLRMGDRIHGHLVAGHVDCVSEVKEVHEEGETRVLWIQIPATLSPFIWKKGSVTVNGVSLTVNAVEEKGFSLCLIPETLKRTNLGSLKVGDKVNLEADYMARGLFHWLKTEGKNLGIEHSS